MEGVFRTGDLKKTDVFLVLASTLLSVIFSAKSEGRRTVRLRMGHDTSSKQHNISS